MTVEVIGIDHVYVTVSDLRRSEEFYDRAMGVLGFRKGRSPIGETPMSTTTTGNTATR